MILTLIGWLAAPGLLYLSGSSVWHAYRDKAPGQWACAGLWACAAVIVLAVLGSLGVVQAAVLALLAAGSAVIVAVVRKEDPGEAFGDLAESLGVAFRPLRGLPGWSRLQVPSLVSRAGGGARPEAVEAVVAEAAATRGIPSVMEDPHLGPAPEPAEAVSASVPVPAAWAALAAYIRDREPADDLEMRMFAEGDMAGALAVADARHHYADVCLNSIGLSPAYVAGELEAGDSMAEHASLLSQVHKRFGVIYGAVKEWVGAHGPLPHKARDFLTGA